MSSSRYQIPVRSHPALFQVGCPAWFSMYPGGELIKLMHGVDAGPRGVMFAHPLHSTVPEAGDSKRTPKKHIRPGLPPRPD
jgi:hypothetical protein